MKQTKTLNPNFRADLVIKYKKENNLTYSELIGLLSKENESILNINESTFKQYLNGSIKEVPIDILKVMANQVGVTLDYFCYNNDVNFYDTQIQDKLGLSEDTMANIIKNKTNRGLFNADKRPKEINKKDYNAILNLLLESKIPMKVGTKSFMDVFNQNMLNLLICSITYDKTFMESFKENFTTLSTKINVNKTKSLGNTDIDMTFNEIFNSATIQKVYRNATNELYDSINKLLKDTLQETFDSIKPITTLF